LYLIKKTVQSKETVGEPARAIYVYHLSMKSDETLPNRPH